jgi:hypothetical protein
MLLPVDVVPPEGSVAEQSTVPASTPEPPEDPELADEPELPAGLEEPTVPEGPEEDWEDGAPEPDPPAELPDRTLEPEAIPEVDPNPSLPPGEEWVDDEHAANTTTAALMNRGERWLMGGILPRSADETERGAATDAGNRGFLQRETRLRRGSMGGDPPKLRRARQRALRRDSREGGIRFAT